MSKKPQCTPLNLKTLYFQKMLTIILAVRESYSFLLVEGLALMLTLPTDQGGGS